MKIRYTVNARGLVGPACALAGVGALTLAIIGPRSAAGPQAAAAPRVYRVDIAVPVRGVGCGWERYGSDRDREFRCEAQGYASSTIYRPDQEPVTYVAQWVLTTPTPADTTHTEK